MLIGHHVMFENGRTGKISKVFNLTEGVARMSPRWILEITIKLMRNECHFDPKIGASLSGKRLFPASEIGKTVMVIFK